MRASSPRSCSRRHLRRAREPADRGDRRRGRGPEERDRRSHRGGPAPMTEAAAAAAPQHQRQRHRRSATPTVLRPLDRQLRLLRPPRSPTAVPGRAERDLRLSARQAHREGSGPRSRGDPGLRPAWPHCREGRAQSASRGERREARGTRRRTGAEAAAPAPALAQLRCRPTRSRPCSRRAPMRKSPSTACARPSPSASSNPSRRCRISIWRSIANSMPSWPCASRSTPARRRTRTASPPTSSRSTTSSSRHWR